MGYRCFALCQMRRMTTNNRPGDGGMRDQIGRNAAEWHVPAPCTSMRGDQDQVGRLFGNCSDKASAHVCAAQEQCPSRKATVHASADPVQVFLANPLIALNQSFAQLNRFVFKRADFSQLGDRDNMDENEFRMLRPGQTDRPREHALGMR